MKRRLGKILVATALMATVGLVANPASPANAHTSTYCGHGVDGILWVTEYAGFRNYGHYVHQHFYYHIHWVEPQHTEWRTCNNVH